MEFVKKNIKWITLGGGLITIISLFLPFVTVSIEFLGQKVSESANFIDGDGAFVFAGVVIAGVLIFLKKEVFSLIPLGICVAITLYDAFNGISKIKEITSLYSGVKLTYGPGLYIGLIGLLLSIAGVCYSQFVLKKNNYSVNNQSYNQGYQPYNYNQPVQPVAQPNYTVGYQQPMQNNYNNDFNISNNSVSPQVGMPTSAVNNDIFNQAPVAQSSPVMEQSVMNNAQPTAPVQDFSSHTTIMCPQCGATLNSGMQFCNQCGSKLN